MREIDSKLITNSIYKCCVDAAYYINDDVLYIIKKAKEKETDSIAKNILSQIIENDKLAKDEFIPMCQDTGVVLVFVEALVCCLFFATVVLLSKPYQRTLFSLELK